MCHVCEPSQPDWGDERQGAHEPYRSDCPIPNCVEARMNPVASSFSPG